jgi:hypothetical protein
MYPACEGCEGPVVHTDVEFNNQDYETIDNCMKESSRFQVVVGTILFVPYVHMRT